MVPSYLLFGIEVEAARLRPAGNSRICFSDSDFTSEGPPSRKSACPRRVCCAGVDSRFRACGHWYLRVFPTTHEDRGVPRVRPGMPGPRLHRGPRDPSPIVAQEIFLGHRFRTRRMGLPSHSYVFSATAVDGFLVFAPANSFHNSARPPNGWRNQDVPPPERLAIWLEFLLTTGVTGMESFGTAGLCPRFTSRNPGTEKKSDTVSSPGRYFPSRNFDSHPGFGEQIEKG